MKDEGMPKKIWLQACPKCLAEHGSGYDITWCQDHVGHACADEFDEASDTGYYRGDLVDQLIALIPDDPMKINTYSQAVAIQEAIAQLKGVNNDA